MAYMEAGTRRLLVSAIFYGLQLTMGYLLMLIIMIYSGALFFAVILGLVIGHILFNAKDAIMPIYETQYLNDVDEKHSVDDGCTDSNAGVETPITQLEEPQSSCCATNQELESDKQYYGSMEGESNIDKVPDVVGNSKQRKPKKKIIDQGIPEGSTPCCQHGL